MVDTNDRGNTLFNVLKSVYRLFIILINIIVRSLIYHPMILLNFNGLHLPYFYIKRHITIKFDMMCTV